MLNKYGERLKNNSGFTLLELILVISILGILAAIAVPKISKTKEIAEIVAHNANVKTLESAANMYILDKGVPNGKKKIILNDNNNELKSYIEEVPKIPNSIKKDEHRDYYTVVIKSDGEIEVEPKKRNKENESK
ncbi:type II secretion system protein [Anaerosalibacter massiliensis]|uniref:Prepilin-type N-terminal cleavage/methylation domain-containing protein n=1 Tax=Anaerosalibacter massiliensis TaxID=1347392 RepID=A0A9X2MFX8_9FIRM|nr:prepilin-type N-terminal cleavage/methylation domain-containing protein [Anaerosalibacter massiliensis]MCR2042818.1 prepilin-type N-terminal cleavage/methylation domain-containing protein [Anaerosalibacter massiliensis]